MDARKEIDVAECLRRGAIGALGAILGTLAAHPIDLVKIRSKPSKSHCAVQYEASARARATGRATIEDWAPACAEGGDARAHVPRVRGQAPSAARRLWYAARRKPSLDRCRAAT